MAEANRAEFKNTLFYSLDRASFVNHALLGQYREVWVSGELIRKDLGALVKLLASTHIVTGFKLERLHGGLEGCHSFRGELAERFICIIQGGCCFIVGYTETHDYHKIKKPKALPKALEIFSLDADNNPFFKELALNSEQEQVYKEVATSKSLMIIGPPGSGKTVLLRQFLIKERALGKAVLYIAYTEKLALELQDVALCISFDELYKILERYKDAVSLQKALLELLGLGEGELFSIALDEVQKLKNGALERLQALAFTKLVLAGDPDQGCSEDFSNMKGMLHKGLKVYRLLGLERYSTSVAALYLDFQGLFWRIL